MYWPFLGPGLSGPPRQFDKRTSSRARLRGGSAMATVPVYTQPFVCEPFNWPLGSIVIVYVLELSNVVVVRVYVPARS